MNKPLLIAGAIAVFGAAAIAIVAGSGSNGAANPVSVGMTRPNLQESDVTRTNGDMRMLSDSRASLRSLNSGTSFGEYSGPLAADTPDRYDESLDSGDSQNRSGSAINQPRRVPSRPDPNEARSQDQSRNDQAQNTRRPVNRAGARGGAASARPGSQPGATPTPNSPMPGGGDGPSGPDLSMLPPGLVIPDGLPQGVIDMLVDAANRGVFQNGGGGSSGGGGSNNGGGGGGNAGGGGSGGDSGSGGSPGGGGGTNIGGGGGGGANGPAAQLVWVTVPISGCSELSGQRSRDLYLRMTSPTRVLSADSGVTTSGLSISGSGFTQVNRVSGFSSPNVAPDEFEIQQNPCVAFDTYLAFGSVNPGILGESPVYEPTLNAQWFGILAEAEQNPALFDDNAYYHRLGRFTAPLNQISINGEIAVDTGPAGGGGLPTRRTLTVPDWNEPNGGLIDGTNGNGSNGGGSDDDGDGNGDGGDSDGDGGGDDGDGDPGGGGGDDNGDGDTTPGNPADITLIWRLVDNQDCAADTNGDGTDDFDLSGTLTYDLMMRTPTPDRLVGVATGTQGMDPFSVAAGGPIVQYPGPENANILPTAEDISDQPCLAFDTYFAIGTTPDIMFITGEPDPTNWPELLSVEWMTDSTVIAQQDTSTFGDSAYYTRLMRLTVEGPSTLAGDIKLTVVPAGTSGAVETQPIEVPQLP